MKNLSVSVVRIPLLVVVGSESVTRQSSLSFSSATWSSIDDDQAAMMWISGCSIVN